MNENFFKGTVIKNGDTYESLAEYLGISAVTLTRKVRPKYESEFTQDEIRRIKEKYHLTPEEVDEIFFADVVS